MRTQGGVFSLTFKIFSLGVMGTLLIIASTLVSCNVSSRQESWNRIREGLTASWSGPQDVTGPILMVPVRLEERGARGELRYRASTAWFLPERLSILGSAGTEVLRHGICKTSVYTADLKLDGAFSTKIPSLLASHKAQPQWDQAKVALGISDLRGIRNDLALEWGRDKLPFDPGSGDEGLKAGALAAKINGERDFSAPFSLAVKLRGSDRLGFLPLGRTTLVDLSSTWRSPEFTGQFFPDFKQVGAGGFRARWNVQQINRNIPQFWIGDARDLSAARFGVDFQIPVDYYRATSRAVQYAAMFIFLAFVAFFLAEFFLEKRLHPMQYLLVGAGIVLFYLLLLSLSEYLVFPLAYALAAGSIVVVISSYVKWVFRRPSAGVVLGGTLAGLYLFFYVLLQMEQYSLLLGSFGLLVALMAVMYATRQMDWYALDLGGEKGEMR